MRQVFNFSAGPAMLPEEVLQQAAAEMLDWHGCGQSVMEMSHRGKEYMSIHAKAEADLRELMNIPDNYKVLFLQGGGSLQFHMVPLNLLRGKSADFVVTGDWSKKAAKDAQLLAPVRIAANGAASQFTSIPLQAEWSLDPAAAYVHLCMNETISGVEFNWLPETGEVPLVADISSCFLSRPVDVSKFGMLYGGAQKNIGPAGLTIVIVREDLLGHAPANTTAMLDYKVQADSDSMFNTPPTFAIYMAGLVFQWLMRNGGIAAIEQRNLEKARLLYEAIDNSKLYKNPVAVADRSRMNVPFTLRAPSLDGAFLKGAEEAHLMQLKGHRTVGGMRASIYNAMPLAGVQKLIAYMQAFEKAHV